jgi:hypothetical protein
VLKKHGLTKLLGMLDEDDLDDYNEVGLAGVLM